MVYNIKDIEISKEDRLLLLTARTGIHDEIKSEIISIIKHDIDWNYLIDTSLGHRLFPLLYWQLNSICSEFVPLKIMERFKSIFRENVQKNLLYMGELLRILEIFNYHDIKAIPYKGLILALITYDNISLRQFDDIDILIGKDDFFKAKELLDLEGYMPKIDLGIDDQNKYLRSQRELQFHDNQKNVLIEIHWKLTGLFLHVPNAYEVLCNMDSIGSVEVDESKISVFKSEEMLLILCLHNASHRWGRLSWISDVAEFVKHNTIDWEKLIEKADKLVVRKILLINLFLACDLFGLKLPERILILIGIDNSIITISQEFEKKLFTDKGYSIKLFEELSISIKLREKRGYGIMDMLKGLTSPTVYELETLPLPHYLFPIYYIYRPLNLIFRHKW